MSPPIRSYRPILLLAVSTMILAMGIVLEVGGGRPPRGGFVAVVGVTSLLVTLELITLSGRIRRLEDRESGES